MAKRLYIETVGCQMNMLDSEMVVASLRKSDFELTSDVEQADVILFNTCSVRQHAEEKIYSALGKLRQLKQLRPDTIIGVLGCMAQKDQRHVLDRAPFVDLVIGPGQLHRIAELIDRAGGAESAQLAVSLERRDADRRQVMRSHETFDPLRDPEMRPTPYQAYLRIQIGCDKFCTYCVVPMTRGPEQGRSPDEILAEARVLADQGCLEVTLLGQTVNSYQYRKGEQTVRLPDLLESLHAISGIERLKFVTSYPKDMTDGLLQAVRDLPKCSPYLHVPLQSGSDAILKRMKRGYTVSQYRDMIERVRQTIPGAAVSSDFIVGFCGETYQDYQQTVEMLRWCRFKNSFIFKYSVRPGTRAAERLPDDVPDGVKRQRNNELLAIQNSISETENLAFIDRQVDVLIEGPSKKAARGHSEISALQLMGRTHCDRIVVFDGPDQLVGQIKPIRIDRVTPHTLLGSLVD